MISAFVESLLGLVDHLTKEGVNFDVEIQSGTLIHIARDKLARKAVSGKYTHILWLDSDMVFQPTLVEDLMDCGKDFVTAIAHSRRKPYASCLFQSVMPPARFEKYPNTPFRVAGCGMAACLIKTEILKAIFLRYGTCYTPMNNIGEDLAFCLRAEKDMHYEIWADPMVRVGHVGHVTIWPEDYDRMKEEIANYGDLKGDKKDGNA